MDEYQTLLARHVEKLSEQQELLYAQDRHSLLLIFQAMDAAGKDGAIKHVMSGINPQGCQVTSFKHPSGSELEHDFLWRTMRELPERGRIGIFNRSYYRAGSWWPKRTDWLKTSKQEFRRPYGAPHADRCAAAGC